MRGHAGVLVRIALLVASAAACDNALLQCDRGGYVPTGHCHLAAYAGKCSPRVWGTQTRCQCPSGYSGPSCTITDHASLCAPGETYSNELFNDLGPQVLSCQVDQTMMQAQQLRLRDHRLDVRLDMTRGVLSAKLVTRDDGPGSRCTKTFVVLDCDAFNCYELVESRTSSGRTVVCPDRSCRALDPALQKSRGVWTRTYNEFMTNGRPVLYTLGRTSPDSAHLEMPIKFMGRQTTVTVATRCRAGTCFTPNREGIRRHSHDKRQTLKYVAHFSAIVIVAIVSVLAITFAYCRNRRRRSQVVVLGDCDDTTVTAGPGIGLQWEGVAVHDTRWCNRFMALLRGRSPVPTTILHPTSGSILPGQLIAVIGPSGSGRSTFLSALGGSSSCPAGVRLTGSSSRPGDIVRYVRQTDCMTESASVWETLAFALKLRLGAALSRRAVASRVTNVLRELQLEPVALSTIRSLSGGQRRRVAIAVELVADPRVLLIDGATDGLDSDTAVLVLRALRNRATATRAAVLVAIHQPPAEAAELLDQVILMAHGGHVVFQGALGAALPVDRHIVGSSQPFEALIELLSDPDVAEHAFTAGLEKPVRADEDAATMHRYVNGRCRQIYLLCSRSFHSTVSSHLSAYMWAMLSSAVVFSFVFSGATMDMDGVRLRMGFASCAVLFLALLSLASIDSYVAELKRFWVESRLAGLYTTSSFVISRLIVDVPFRLLPALLFTCVSYSLVGMRIGVGPFLVAALMIALANVVAGSSIFLISAMSRTARSATFIAMLFILFNFVFGNPLLSKANPATFASRLSSLSYFHYAVEALLMNEFIGPATFQLSEGMRVGGEWVLDKFGIPGQVLTWMNVRGAVSTHAAALVVTLIVINVTALCVLKYRRFKSFTKS